MGCTNPQPRNQRNIGDKKDHQATSSLPQPPELEKKIPS